MQNRGDNYYPKEAYQTGENFNQNNNADRPSCSCSSGQCNTNQQQNQSGFGNLFSQFSGGANPLMNIFSMLGGGEKSPLTNLFGSSGANPQMSMIMGMLNNFKPKKVSNEKAKEEEIIVEEPKVKDYYKES